jgi:hypothetical protein
MDSLPEQHIATLPAATREAAYRKVGLVFLSRREGIESEDEVARRADFGSAAAMHHQLRLWGLAGLLPPEDEEQVPTAKMPEARDEPKARGGGGEAEELPAAAGAIELFQAAIGRLKSDLAYVTYLEEALQDRRFVQTLYYPKEAGMHPDVYRREMLSHERWEELCAEQGQDPLSTDTLYVPVDRRFLAGASPFPAMQLVRLITVYLLCVARTWHDVEVLLERLHPASREPDVEKIKRYLTGETPRRDRDDALLPITKHLARLVRGGVVPPGRNPGRLDSADHTVARHIRDLKEQGVPEEDIRRVLREEHKVPEDEISRLSKIFPPHSSE